VQKTPTLFYKGDCSGYHSAKEYKVDNHSCRITLSFFSL
jgi:hypothetical protein